MLLTIFVLIETATLVFYTVQKAGESNKFLSAPLKLSSVTSNPDELPDIFFVVFDEYASSPSLREDLGFDNKQADSLLKRYNFYASEKSVSNYNLTPFSLASTLNLSLLDVDSNNYIISGKEILQSVDAVRDSWLLEFLRSKNYGISNYGCFDFAGAPVLSFPYFGEDYRVGAINSQTLYSRIRKDIWWNFIIRDLFTGQFKVPQSYTTKKNKHLDRNEFNYQGLLKELQTESDKAKFVYCHLILPHQPFYINDEGGMVSDTAIILKQVDSRKGYLNQVAYANKLLNKLVPLCSAKTKRKRVVIIEGDHGYRYYKNRNEREKTFSNMNNYYFSDGDYSLLYNGISPVNSFRVILNKYFSQSLPMLPDSTTYLVDPEFEHN